LGDTIQFARFLPALQHVARRLIIWAQPQLIPLLQAMGGSSDFLGLHDGAPHAEYDADIEIMEILQALRVTSNSLPARVPYFSVTPAPRLSERFSVGVVAAAGDWDSKRSIPTTRWHR
jgi:hypothetical protein